MINEVDKRGEKKSGWGGCLALLGLAAIAWFLVFLMLLGAIALFTGKANAAEPVRQEITAGKARQVAAYAVEYLMVQPMAGPGRYYKVFPCTEGPNRAWRCKARFGNHNTECTLEVKVWRDSKDFWVTYRNMRCQKS